MFCLMRGSNCTSSICVGIYMCSMSQGWRGWFLSLIICRYGDIDGGVGILVILSGNAYWWWIKVRRPPLAGL